MHTHTWVNKFTDDNDNRTRTLDACACGSKRHGCLAKRLDAGVAAWGPVGEQVYVIKPEEKT